MAGGPIKLKCCTKCKQWKKALPENYSACKATRDKFQSWCRVCVKALVKGKYQTDPVYHKAINDYQRGYHRRLLYIKQIVARMLANTGLKTVEALEAYVAKRVAENKS